MSNSNEKLAKTLILVEMMLEDDFSKEAMLLVIKEVKHQLLLDRLSTQLKEAVKVEKPRTSHLDNYDL